MKKKKIIIIVLLCIPIFYFVMVYNSLVNKDEAVMTAWSQVENQYQRRADLIPNLVNTVKGYAEHEQETLKSVVEARTKATQTSIDAENLDAQSIQEFQAVQDELSASLSKLLVVVESYPDLKANENFLALQAQLEGTENRISYERKRFNEAAQSFNSFSRRFPNNLIANIGGFERKEYFTAQKGADEAVKVEF